MSIMPLRVYASEAHSSGRQNETRLPGEMKRRGNGGAGKEMRRDARKERTLTQLTVVAAAVLSVRLRREQRRGGCGETISKEREREGEICEGEKKDSWREGEEMFQRCELGLCWMDYSG